MAITQIRMHGTRGHTYYQAKITEGKTPREAQRCLIRRLADHVWRMMVADERRRTQTTGPGGQPGGDYSIQRGRPNPDGRLFGQVTSRTRRNRAYVTTPTSLTNTEAPKDTDLTVHTREHLNAVAAELNSRPRKKPGWETPAERLHTLLTAA